MLHWERVHFGDEVANVAALDQRLVVAVTPMTDSPDTITCPKCSAEYPASRAPAGARLRCVKCGTTFAATGSEGASPKRQKATLVGRTLGGYEVLEQIARGGMGSVYRARQIALGRVVALKRLSTRLVGEQFLQRFLREARAAAKLSHPNIVQVYDIGQDYGFHFIAMEFVEGETLKERVETRGALLPLEAARIGADVARALTCARESNIVHRDIKPDNVLMSLTGEVKVADFGLAKLVGDTVKDSLGDTQEGLGLGTPHYMAPEQASNAKAADHRSDMYSLGCTVYHTLTGRPPFDALSAYELVKKHETEAAISPCDYNPDIPASFASLVAQMMTKAPDHRPQEPREVVDGLEAIIKEIRRTEDHARRA